MKKIFTFLVAVLFAGIISAQAVKISFDPCDYDDNSMYKSFESELTREADGSYTIANFFNSGKPVSFKFEVPTSAGEYNDITFTSPLLARGSSGNYFYLMYGSGEDDYLDIDAYDLDDNLVYLYYPYVAVNGYSYVYKQAAEYVEEYGEYGAVICMKAYNEDNTLTGWIYINFYFDEIPIPGDDPSRVEGIAAEADAVVEYFNLQGIKVANPENGVFIRRQGSKVSKVAL